MISKVKIIPLNTIRYLDEAIVGAKAMSLCRMSQIDLKVPSGFCIMATAFREHLEANELVSKVESTLDKLNSASPEERKSILLEIQQAIVNAPLGVKLRNEIENHYHKLAAKRVAVRSSATTEDLPGHSFAGQYDTYLGIVDLEGCIDAVKKCWASLWTERAYDYRQKNAFDHLKVNMAVIVQTLIEADASGVIFTADPINGYKSRMIIETVPGLGDTLVSGKATPQRFVVGKKQCRIVSKNLISESCITDSVVRRLVKLGKKVEKHFGSPQDIEWAIYKNKIYFLQSRSITVIPAKKSWEERQAWTNANVGEVFPDAMTPVTWSVMELMFNPLFESTIRLFGANLGNNQLAGLVASRVYFNINTAMGVAQHLPEKWNLSLNDSFGGEQGKVYELGKLDIPDEDIPDLGFSYAKMIIRLPYSICDIFSHSQKKGMKVLKKLSSSSKKLRDLDVSATIDEKLARQFITAIEDTLESCNLLCVLIGILTFPILRWICAKWLGDSSGTIANSLLVGIGNMDSAQAALDLWQLAQKAHKIVEVEKTILSGDDWKATRKKIRQIPKGEQFLENWDEFMTRHGHHCRGEMELFNPRWSEKPDYILSTVRNYLGGTGQTDPIQNYHDQIRKREQLTNRCRQQLKNPAKRMIFNHIVHRAQQGVIFRENWKSEAVRYTAALRSILLELGQRLNNKSILENTDDIFFLKYQEIQSVVQGNADFDIRKVIAQRHVEYEKNKSITPPTVVIGKFDSDSFIPDAVDTNVEVLNGLAVSSGVVTGKARVILKADTDEQVLPGEILVAPFTDPGWTPYFIPAAAIVMDIGGMLSHGSIIAREYGIPAVVNVGPATKIIQTGQTIQVDANRGIVRILK